MDLKRPTPPTRATVGTPNSATGYLKPQELKAKDPSVPGLGFGGQSLAFRILKLLIVLSLNHTSTLESECPKVLLARTARCSSYRLGQACELSSFQDHRKAKHESKVLQELKSRLVRGSYRDLWLKAPTNALNSRRLPHCRSAPTIFWLLANVLARIDAWLSDLVCCAASYYH